MLWPEFNENRDLFPEERVKNGAMRRTGSIGSRDAMGWADRKSVAGLGSISPWDSARDWAYYG